MVKSSRNRIVAASSGLCVLLLGGAAGWWLWAGEDPDLVAIRDLRAGLAEADLPPEKRRETFEAIRTAVDALPKEKREIARDEMRQGFRAMMERRLDDWFAASPEEKVEQLDQFLDRMVERRKSGGGRGGPPGGGNRPTDPQSRSDRRKERMNNTSPEQRAKFEEFRDALRGRAEQRGIDLPGRFGR